jgi:hypothetical protein
LKPDYRLTRPLVIRSTNQHHSVRKSELVGNYFGSIYLTVISLLQGIALSLLVPLIVRFFDKSPNPLTDYHLVPLLLMLLIIFIVWHQYAIGIFYLRWFPNIIDTAIPFMISIGQFFLIYFMTFEHSPDEMRLHEWHIGFIIFMLCGCVPFFAAAARLDGRLFTNIMFPEAATEHERRVRQFHTLAGWMTLGQGLIALLLLLVQNHSLLWVSLILFVMYLIFTEYYTLKFIKPHFEKSMDEYNQ